jgi:hypothetical protein
MGEFLEVSVHPGVSAHAQYGEGEEEEEEEAN